MKSAKTFAGVFLLMFTTGYFIVPQRQKNLPQAISTAAPIEKSTATPIMHAPELEIIEEVEGWTGKEENPYKIKLLETGEGFHGTEVKAKSGETWLGLFNDGGNFSLRPAEIKIRRVQDDIVDGQNAAKKTGKSVAVEGKLKPIFLLKNADELRRENITTLFQGLTMDDVLAEKESDLAPDQMLTTLGKDFARKYKIGAREYELKVIEAKNKSSEKILALVLESGGTRQVLHTICFDCDSSLGTLYWVGDLEGDGKPDFYFDLFEHENVGNKVLFLSSEAEKGKLVKTVAQFWTTGC